MAENEPKPQTVDEAYPEADSIIKGIIDSGDPVQDPSAASEPAGEDVQEEVVEEEEGGSEPSEKPTEASKPDLSADEEAAHKSALANLKLAAKAPDAVLDGMDPREIIAWWSGLAEKKAADDRTYRERAELQKRLEDLQATREAEPAVPTASTDLETYKPLVEEFGEDPSGALDEHIMARIQSALGEGPKKLAQLEQALEAMYMKQVRGELGITQLTDPQVWERVQARTGELWATTAHGNLQGLERLQAVMRDAAKLELPDLPTPEQERAEKEEAAARRKGSPKARASKPKKSKPQTHEEMVDAMARYITEHDGVTSEQVRAHFGV